MAIKWFRFGQRLEVWVPEKRAAPTQRSGNDGTENLAGWSVPECGTTFL